MKHFQYILISCCILLSCSEEQFVKDASELFDIDENYISKQSSAIKYEDSEIVFLSSPSGSLIEEITKQRENIVYRITKIDNKAHLIKQGVTNSQELEIALNDLKNEQLFYIEFADNSKTDLLKQEFKDENYSAAIKYLTDQIKGDFVMVFENDTIEPSFYNYERSFHVAPFERVLIGFSNVNSDRSMELIYEDRLFGKGLLKFAFPSNSYIENNSDFVL